MPERLEIARFWCQINVLGVRSEVVLQDIVADAIYALRDPLVEDIGVGVA